MRKLFLLTIRLIFSHVAMAQNLGFDLWYDGKVVLQTDDTLRGFIKYELSRDYKQDNVQVKTNNQAQRLGSHKVIYFEFFDATARRYRSFYSFPFSENNTYKSPVFFELLCEGKRIILNRERMEYRTVGSPYFYYGTTTRLVLVNDYYLLKPDGMITPVANRKSEWLRLMGDHEREVVDFTKTNKLDFDEKYELVRILEYYNSLAK